MTTANCMAVEFEGSLENKRENLKRQAEDLRRKHITGSGRMHRIRRFTCP